MANDSQSRTARRKQMQQKGKPKKKNNKPLFKKILLSLLIIGLVAMIGIGGLFTYYISGAPNLDEAKLSDPISSKVYDMNGDLFAELGSEKRTKITYNDLPPVLIDAVTATEDARFFEHSGIDFRRIGAAVVANVTEGFGAEGASTITQQVVKRSFLSPKKALERKVQEQWLAIKLEQEYSKEEILQMYLNKIFYGSQAYGVAEAAETYFGVKELNELTLPQAALLAGLPQRPTAYNPYKNPDLAKERMNTVLTLMVHHGKISEAEAEEARKVKIEDMLKEGGSDSKNKYQHFLDQVQREVEKKVEGADIYKDGLKIYTTVDPKAQEHMEYLLSKENPLGFPDDEIQTASTVIDTKTGQIRAIGGGRDFEGSKGGYNLAIQGGRQPGSTAKPILAYGPAIESKALSSYHQIEDDEPIEINGDTINNYGKYHGWVSMRYALTKSLNVPAVKTMQEVGLEESKKFAEGLGINFKDGEIYPADAIGGAKTELTTTQLAASYAAFGNEGMYNEPYAVTKVEFPDGKTEEFKSEPKAAMSKYTAFVMSDMLKSVLTHPEGTGQAANISGLPVAGKTGTTNREDISPDSWFSGYTTNYSIAVWTGYAESNERDASAGDHIPKAFFKSMMSTISEGKDTADFAKPDSAKWVDVEKGSRPAKYPSEYTPESEIVTELFHKDNMPKETSEQYDQLDPVEGLSAKYDEKKGVIKVDWKYGKAKDIAFDVTVSMDGQGEQKLTTTTDKKLEVSNVQPGTTYTFNVTAISSEGDGNRSEPSSVDVSVPEQEEEDDGGLFGDDEEENEDDEQQGNEGNNGQGNGNGNGGQGNDDGQDDEGTGDDQEGDASDDGTTGEGQDDGSSGDGTGDGQEGDSTGDESTGDGQGGTDDGTTDGSEDDTGTGQ
ncbi:PBP1A family penicillin-binding protein [Thalassobacillus hwangdonensis]|uniref:PBP1A family penicillin-binding protein n=1 Tax=Thalassobacillus hwangdonensis TaxID=546108 RepID=A0ABW3KX50_9BACI